MRESQDGSDDPFRPPDIPIEVHCIHCGEEYESYLIKWVVDEKGEGFWCCPTPGCDGIGFCFDIWPTDPEWRDEDGNKVVFFDDGEYDEEEYDEDDSLEGESEVPWQEMDSSNGDGPDNSTFGDEDIPF